MVGIPGWYIGRHTMAGIPRVVHRETYTLGRPAFLLPRAGKTRFTVGGQLRHARHPFHCWRTVEACWVCTSLGMCLPPTPGYMPLSHPL